MTADEILQTLSEAQHGVFTTAHAVFELVRRGGRKRAGGRTGSKGEIRAGRFGG
jgi:hypothetical protein